MAQDFYTLSDAEQGQRLQALAQEALKQWPGVYENLRLIKHRENAVFAARRDDGLPVAVRVHRHGYHSDARLASELAWMQALARDGLPVPMVMPTRDDALFTHASVKDVPEARQVDVLEWRPGAPLGASDEPLPYTPETSRAWFARAGALAARLHDHTRQWQPPALFERHAWDAEGLVGAAPLWGDFLALDLLTPEERALLRAARDRAALELAQFGTGPDRYGLIHADFVGENLLCHEDGLTLIDFDDCGYGWHMFELATALYFRSVDSDFPALAAAMLEGYTQGHPCHADRLGLFLFLRGTTYLGWVQTRRETQTAREMAPFLIELACARARDYLNGRDWLAPGEARQGAPC